VVSQVYYYPIKAFDAYGREVTIQRDVWRNQVLPNQLRQEWNNPEGLANCIIQALRDEFASEVLSAARHLPEINHNQARAAILLGVTLLQIQNFKEADFVLTLAAAKFPRDGNILTNLAKARNGLGQHAMSETILWRAIEADPNLDNGMLWYVAIQKERGGDEAEKNALLRIAALPNSWRASLWLARRALQKDNDLSSAMNYYNQALNGINPLPADILMQISGDLGNSGHLMELLQVCEPKFDVKLHGLMVGNNLIKAYLDTGQPGPARIILNQLYTQQRPDWNEMLLFWDKEIDKLDKDYGPKGHEVPEISMLYLNGPIWAREGTPFSEILPAKDENATKIAFVCGSVAMPPPKLATEITSQPTDAEGRMSRALPLFLAEQVHIHTQACGAVLMPWMKNGGFVVAGQPWDHASPGLAAPGIDFLVAFHLLAESEPWTAQFTLVRTLDSIVLATWQETLDPKDCSSASNVSSP